MCVINAPPQTNQCVVNTSHQTIVMMKLSRCISVVFDSSEHTTNLRRGKSGSLSLKKKKIQKWCSSLLSGVSVNVNELFIGSGAASAPSSLAPFSYPTNSNSNTGFCASSP